MNFWDLKWQERKQMRCDVFEDMKSPLALAMAELLEEISVFIEALETVKPRWRVAEMYLSALVAHLFEKPTNYWRNRNDLSSSFPHSLGGFEPSLPKNNHHYPSRFDDHAFHNITPPDYTTAGDYRNPAPEYRVAPPSITTYGYDTPVEPSERSPHFFEFSHITRFPVPSTLSTPSIVSCQRDQTKPTQSTTVQSQRVYDRLSMHTDLSVHSRPAPLFDERVIDETPATQRDPSIRQQFTIASRPSCGVPVSVPTHRRAVSNFRPNQPRYSARMRSFFLLLTILHALVGQVIGIIARPIHMDRALITQPFNLLVYRETERPRIHLVKSYPFPDAIDLQNINVPPVIDCHQCYSMNVPVLCCTALCYLNSNQHTIIAYFTYQLVVVVLSPLNVYSTATVEALSTNPTFQPRIVDCRFHSVLLVGLQAPN